MPRVNASNGIRPEIRALGVIKKGVPVTPAEINEHVGTGGDYAAKYVSFLNTRYGFQIDAVKEGRRVVSYILVSEPDNVEDLRNQTPRLKKTLTEPPKEKVAKPPKQKKEEPKKTGAAARAANLEKLREVGKRFAKKDEVEEELGSTGEVATSYTVDEAWDSVEGLDVSKLL